MGHYLNTSNPEAVDTIGGEPATPPDIGTPVVFLSRPGEGRSGRTEFPATVLSHDSDDCLHLLVIYAVDDAVEIHQVREFSEDHLWPAWRHRRESEPEKFEPSRLNNMRVDLEAMRKKLDETIAGVYGEWAAPPESMMADLVKFESTLQAIEKRVAAIEKKSK